MLELQVVRETRGLSHIDREPSPNRLAGATGEEAIKKHKKEREQSTMLGGIRCCGNFEQAVAAARK